MKKFSPFKEMGRMPKRNILEMIYPFFISYKVINIAQFTLTVNKYGDFIVKRYVSDYLHTIFTICLDIYFFYLSLINCYNCSTTNKIITDRSVTNLIYIGMLNIGNKMFIFASIFFSVYVHLSITFNYQKYWNIFLIINQIDMELVKLKFEIDNNLHYKWVLYGFLAGNTYSVCVILTVISILKLTFIEAIFQILPSATYALVMTFYFFYVIIMYIRIRQINRAIRYYFVELPTKNRPLSKTHSRNLIKKFGRLCIKLKIQLELTNQLFGTTIILCMAAYFVYMVFGSFSIFLLIQRYDKGIAAVAIIYIAFSAIYSAMYFMVISAGTLIKYEGEASGRVLHQACNLPENLHIAKYLAYLSFQVGQVRPTAAFAYVHFDLSLVYSMMTALVTYLIILVQFASQTN